MILSLEVAFPLSTLELEISLELAEQKIKFAGAIRFEIEVQLSELELATLLATADPLFEAAFTTPLLTASPLWASALETPLATEGPLFAKAFDKPFD